GRSRHRETSAVVRTGPTATGLRQWSGRSRKPSPVAGAPSSPPEQWAWPDPAMDDGGTHQGHVCSLTSGADFGTSGGANPVEVDLPAYPRGCCCRSCGYQGGPMSEENANDQRRDTRGFGAAAPRDRAGSAEQSAHHAAQGEVPAQED